MRKVMKDNFTVAITGEDVLACMPYMSNVVDNNVISDVVNAANKVLDYIAVSVVSDAIEFDEEGLCIEGVYIGCGHRIVSMLKGSRKMAVVVCSLGQPIIDLCGKFKSEGDLLKAYLCDAIANIAIGKLEDAVKEKLYLEEAAPYTWKSSTDFSPGDCAWNLEEQGKLLSLLPESSCPVQLTASYLMKPLKSISFMMGFGPDLRCVRNKCLCCNLKQCSYKGQIKWK
ncbi:MAG TPA: hypothetical protein H9814_07640 [Candidatus Bacteroides merdigallinarum]|uniref:Methionine synthase n=1 Tax=Candidatus Bacteroides merdigallinarum TaxID=2838473 RepID=A0A9D2E9T9_9BACE|nr:hypothetical protein [Candidatus Bacteroides merdigallinarum]